MPGRSDSIDPISMNGRRSPGTCSVRTHQFAIVRLPFIFPEQLARLLVEADHTLDGFGCFSLRFRAVVHRHDASPGHNRTGISGPDGNPPGRPESTFRKFINDVGVAPDGKPPGPPPLGPVFRPGSHTAGHSREQPDHTCFQHHFRSDHCTEYHFGICQYVCPAGTCLTQTPISFGHKVTASGRVRKVVPESIGNGRQEGRIRAASNTLSRDRQGPEATGRIALSGSLTEFFDPVTVPGIERQHPGYIHVSRTSIFRKNHHTLLSCGRILGTTLAAKPTLTACSIDRLCAAV